MTTSYAWPPCPAAPPSPSVPSSSSSLSLQWRNDAGGPRQPCPTAACRSRRSRSASCCVVWSAAAATADVAFGALAAALPRPALAEQSLSDHSSSILANSPSRQRRRLAAVSAVVTEWSSAHAVARFGSLRTQFGGHVALGERGAATGIVLVIPLLLSSRALRLRHDVP